MLNRASSSVLRVTSPDNPRRTMPFSLLTLGVSDVEQSATFYVSAGFERQRTSTPDLTDWGGYAGYVADPDGHLWELAYNRFWTSPPPAG